MHHTPRVPTSAPAGCFRSARQRCTGTARRRPCTRPALAVAMAALGLLACVPGVSITFSNSTFAAASVRRMTSAAPAGGGGSGSGGGGLATCASRAEAAMDVVMLVALVQAVCKQNEPPGRRNWPSPPFAQQAPAPCRAACVPIGPHRELGSTPPSRASCGCWRKAGRHCLACRGVQRRRRVSMD